MERNFLANIERNLTDILSRVPKLSVRRAKRKSDADMVWDIRLDGTTYELVIDVKRLGGAGAIREAARGLDLHIERRSAAYAVLGVPYLTARSIDACRQEGVGCVDTAGNCLLSFGEVYIEIQGNPNPAPVQREIKSLFSPKSSRVARVLLSDTGRWWGVREIAAEAEINPGLVSRLKGRLRGEGLVRENEEGRIMADPLPLLEAWSANYNYRRNEIREFYSLDTPEILEKRLAAYSRESGVAVALTLFSGASHVAPHVRMSKLFAYIDEDLDIVAEPLGLKPVSSGANVMLLGPYDAGVFMKSREVKGASIVSNVQLYLDLKGYRGRGEEAAEFLLEHQLKPQWEHEANTSRRK